MVVVVCATSGLTVSEAKTEIIVVHTDGIPGILRVEAAGQMYVCMYDHHI